MSLTLELDRTGAAAPITLNTKVSGPMDGRRILVVDDCPDNRELFQRLLERRGATVTLAEDGEEAVTIALAAPFDVVLMDIQMPVVDGFEAMATLKTAGCTTPAIALTALARGDDMRRILAIGFSAHVSKPIDIETLFRVIQEVLPPRSLNVSSVAK